MIEATWRAVSQWIVITIIDICEYMRKHLRPWQIVKTPAKKTKTAQSSATLLRHSARFASSWTDVLMRTNDTSLPRFCGSFWSLFEPKLKVSRTRKLQKRSGSSAMEFHVSRICFNFWHLSIIRPGQARCRLCLFLNFATEIRISRRWFFFVYADHSACRHINADRRDSFFDKQQNPQNKLHVWNQHSTNR